MPAEPNSTNSIAKNGNNIAENGNRIAGNADKIFDTHKYRWGVAVCVCSIVTMISNVFFNLRSKSDKNTTSAGDWVLCGLYIIAVFFTIYAIYKKWDCSDNTTELKSFLFLYSFLFFYSLFIILNEFGRNWKYPSRIFSLISNIIMEIFLSYYYYKYLGKCGTDRSLGICIPITQGEAIGAKAQGTAIKANVNPEPEQGETRLSGGPQQGENQRQGGGGNLNRKNGYKILKNGCRSIFG